HRDARRQVIQGFLRRRSRRAVLLVRRTPEVNFGTEEKFVRGIPLLLCLSKDDAVRQARAVRWLDEIRGDLRYGLRQLWRAPVFTVVAVITLAIAIGANTSIFTLEDAVMLKPLPVTDPGALRQLEWTSAHPAF